LEQLPAGGNAAVQFRRAGGTSRDILLEERAKEAPHEDRCQERNRAGPAIQEEEDAEPGHQVGTAARVDARLLLDHFRPEIVSLLNGVDDLMLGGMVTGEPREAEEDREEQQAEDGIDDRRGQTRGDRAGEWAA